MRLFRCTQSGFFVALVLCAPKQTLSQQKPITRTFTSAVEERYQVTVALHVETHGLTTNTVAEKTFAGLYTHIADGQAAWRLVRTIASVHPDGSAFLTESRDQLSAHCDGDPSSQSFSAALQKSVQDTCAEWLSAASPSQYEESPLGIIRGLPLPGEDQSAADSSLLSLWLRRAFRPSVILPNTPIQFASRTTRKVTPDADDAAKPSGEESTEWLESAGETPAATLHVSQNLSWKSPATKTVSGKLDRPESRQLFYADSLNTLSLLDGSLVKATRTATTETKDLLDPVPGLEQPPLFGTKLTITVSILKLP